MEKIELKVLNLSTIVNPMEACALILKEVNGKRKLPVIIFSREAQAIMTELSLKKFPRPLTHDLFPALTKQIGVTLVRVEIYKVKDGVFYSYLYFQKDGEEYQVDARTSDAVALAMRYNCPIYTSEEIMQSEKIKELREDSFSVPLNSVNLDLLKEALEKAIKEEKYEQATYLRDEIKRREEESFNQ